MSGKHRLFLGIVILTVMAALGGCQPKASQNEAAASPQAMATAGPAYQHRTFDSGDTEKTLRAIVSTLQDLDFVIGKVDVSRGTPVIAATMANAGGVTGIAATVWQKSPEQTVVRVYGTQGKAALANPGYYQSFFDALSRTLSLPAHTDEEAAAPAPTPVHTDEQTPTSVPSTPAPAQDAASAPASAPVSAPDAAQP